MDLLSGIIISFESYHVDILGKNYIENKLLVITEYSTIYPNPCFAVRLIY